jgi:hypothetical protein
MFNSKIVDDFVAAEAIELNKVQQTSTRELQQGEMQVLENRVFPRTSEYRLGHYGPPVFTPGDWPLFSTSWRRSR